jgi:L-iditol 2-dehydrogenase
LKAALLNDINVIEVKEVMKPSVGNGDILVEMKACGLCGTDLEKLQGQYTAAKPVLGHEAAGIVVETGSDVNQFVLGDRVFPHHHTPCNNCKVCKKGNETMCTHYRASNLDPSGFSEYFRVPAWNIKQGGVLQLPEKVSFEEASFIEPIACCIRGLSRSKVSSDDTVLVIGAGPVGLTHLQLLKQIGSNILISDINKKRLNIAKAQGASKIYNIREVDIPTRVKEDTDGLGVDVALIATGNPKGIIQALKAVRKGGTVCLFGVPVVGSILNYDFSDIFNSETSIISSYGATETETKKSLEMIETHKVNPTSLITDRFTLEEFREAISKATKGEGMKTIITP